MSNVLQKVIKILVDDFGFESDEVHGDAKLVDDLLMDEIDLIDLIIEIENQFELDEISDEKLRELFMVTDDECFDDGDATVSDFADLIEFYVY